MKKITLIIHTIVSLSCIFILYKHTEQNLTSQIIQLLILVNWLFVLSFLLYIMIDEKEKLNMENEKPLKYIIQNAKERYFYKIKKFEFKKDFLNILEKEGYLKDNYHISYSKRKIYVFVENDLAISIAIKHINRVI